MTTKRVVVDQTSFGVLDVGAGMPIVLLHGFPLDHSMWQHQIDALSSSYRVIAPDLRGHGTSEVTEGVVTMSQMAGDVAGILDSLSVDGPVVLCGLSMGGYVAWEFWRRFADRLAKLVLCDTRAAADSAEVATGREMMATQVLSIGARLAVDSMLPKLFASRTVKHKPRTVQAVRDVILATDPRAIAATQRGMARRDDMTSRLSAVEVPTLVMCGAEDQITPPDEMRRVATALPNASYVEIAEAGHLAPLEQPDPTNEAIKRFLES